MQTTFCYFMKLKSPERDRTRDRIERAEFKWTNYIYQENSCVRIGYPAGLLGSNFKLAALRFLLMDGVSSSFKWMRGERAKKLPLIDIMNF